MSLRHLLAKTAGLACDQDALIARIRKTVKPSYAPFGNGELELRVQILSIAIAFLGYSLPREQISYRGATIITNLTTAIPYV